MVVAGREYQLDCIIYACGFEVGTTYARRTGFDLTGRDGVMLSDYWADRMRTLHGIHSRGFPNTFIVQPTQGAMLISNVPHNLRLGRDDHADDQARTRQWVREIEVAQDAEDAWIALLGDRCRIGDRRP